MENYELQKHKRMAIAISIYCVIFAGLLLISNLGHFNVWVERVLSLFRPVIIGLVLAYLCNPIFRLFEKKIFARINPFGVRRGISLTFTYLSLFAIFFILIMLIVPQLVDSVVDFINNSDGLLLKLGSSINTVIDKLNGFFPAKADGSPMITPLRPEMVSDLAHRLLDAIQLNDDLIMKLLNAETLGSILKIAEGVVDVIGDTLFGLFISLYLLHTKEKRYAQIMRWRKSLFSENVNGVITKICTTADKSFGGFLKGKVFDSCIVGILVYIAISIIGVPYATLIAVIVAITDIVPVIGPFIGVIPSAVIILLTDHTKVIPFIICILIIQQIDGNILAPRILGEHTGVSSLCVLIAICTMGTLWGLAGMVLGVPLFATVIELTGSFLDNRLRKKGLPVTIDGVEPPDENPEANPRDRTMLERLSEWFGTSDPSAVVGGNGSFNAAERFALDTYELAQMHNLFSEQSDDVLSEFAAAETTLAMQTAIPIKQKAVEIKETENEKEVVTPVEDTAEAVATADEALQAEVGQENATNAPKARED